MREYRMKRRSSLIRAGTLIEGLGVFGVVWIRPDLIVEDAFGRIVSFVTIGRPVTESLIAFIGLEEEMQRLTNTPGDVLNLPAVAVAHESGVGDKLNFMLFFDSASNRIIALAYRSQAQTEIEVELSRQIRARLMAEAETQAKSEELARANADLEGFASLISHDLKAPLRHMRYLADEAKAAADSAGLSQVTKYLDEITTQSRRMSNMLTALFDYSVIGRKYEMAEPVDVRQLAEDTAKQLPLAGFDVSFRGDWPTLTTLRAPLALAVHNLMANARQHHDRSHGEIVLRCRDNNSAIELDFSDDGPGIYAQHHETIFLPFRNLTSSGQAESSGMGLAMVRKIVDSMGGSIRVHSAPERERGSTFTLIWPKRLRI